MQHHQFDGVVLEIWSQLGGHHKRLDILTTSFIALFCMYDVPLLIPSLVISPSLHFKQEIAFSTFILLVCILISPG